MALQTEFRDNLMERLLDFVQTTILNSESGSGKIELGPDTPLLEWGVLNSINTVRLLAYIRETFDVTIPPIYLTAKNFKNLDSIADMVLSVKSE